MMRRVALLAASCLGCALWTLVVVSAQNAAPATSEATGPIVPVHHEPHHRQVFQYGPMRILDLQLPPGDMSWFHTHEWPVFYLTTSDSQTVSQNLGEEWGAGRGRGAAPRGGGAGRGDAGRGGAPAAAPAAAPPGPAAGPDAAATGAARAGGARGGAAPAGGRGFRPRLMYDLSYAERAVTHRIRNDGTGLFRSMVVVNETAGGDETVTEEAAGFTGKPISSNRWFRSYRIALAPGEKSSHQHKAPVVILQDTTGKGVGAGAMKFEFNEPGQWAFFDAGDRHEVANTGTERLELIEVELRRR